MIRAVFLLSPALLLVGCASVDSTGYPSLEQRSVEARTASAVPAPAPDAAAPVTDADRAAVAALATQASGGESAFRAALPLAERRALAARGQAAGSDVWFDAQAALSALEQTRAPTLAALAELDRRQLAAELAGQSALAALLATEQRRAADWVAAQTAVLDRISTQLGI